jgi:hypothetical protein
VEQQTREVPIEMGGPIMGQKNAAREVDAGSADDCTDSSTARAHIAHNGDFHSARELRNKICQQQTPRFIEMVSPEWTRRRVSRRLRQMLDGRQ